MASEKKEGKKNLFGLVRSRRNSQSNQSAKSSGIFSIFSGNKSTVSHEPVISSPVALQSEDFILSHPRAASANPEAEPRRSFEPPQRPLTAQGDSSSFIKRKKMTVIPEVSHPNLLEKALADAKAAEKKASANLEVPNANTEGIPGIPPGSYSCDHHNLPFPIVPLDTPHPPNTAEIICRTHMHKHIVPIPAFTPDDIKITIDITQEPIKLKRTDIIGRSRVLDEMISKLPYGHPLDLSHYNTFISTRLVQWLTYAQFQYTDLDTRAINNPTFDFIHVVASLQLFDLWKRMKHDLAASLAVQGVVGKFDCSQFFEVLTRMYACVNKIEPKDRRELDGMVDKALARFPFIEICRVISKLSTDRAGLVNLFQTLILQKGKKDHLKEEKEEADAKARELENREPSFAKDIRTVVDATTEMSAQMRNILTAQIAGQQNKPNQQTSQGRRSLDRTPDRAPRHTSRMGGDPWADSGSLEGKQQGSTPDCAKKVERERDRNRAKDREKPRSRVV
ncbi:hypothetical protein AA313_de0206130 [Arthrobotrys entomopaga]|nr:hypothetical protein AA313_de0206130 [Arthrobotrys entomopaga]